LITQLKSANINIKFLKWHNFWKTALAVQWSHCQ